MDTTTFIFVLIGVATAAAWPLRIVDLIEGSGRHETR
mgnify:CR=1 FL=1